MTEIITIFSGIGLLAAFSLCMTGRSNLDVLASLYFHDMASNTYELPTTNDKRSDKHHAATSLRGKRLFSPEINYEDLLSWLDEGADVRSTSLTAEFTIDLYGETYQDRFMALFVVESSGRLRVVTDKADISADCKIISLIKPDNI
tara:strand:- start:66 stop:503 length:438 start_codon:yes stop_codon:yes gene_type:complete